MIFRLKLLTTATSRNTTVDHCNINKYNWTERLKNLDFEMRTF